MGEASREAARCVLVGAVVCLLVLVSALGNAQGTAGGASATGRTALTIYNQDFAVIRTPVELDPACRDDGCVGDKCHGAGRAGFGCFYGDVTGQAGPIHILEQNYDGALRVQSPDAGEV